VQKGDCDSIAVTSVLSAPMPYVHSRPLLSYITTAKQTSYTAAALQLVPRVVDQGGGGQNALNVLMVAPKSPGQHCEE
jgi:hypothetical protein